MRAFFQKHYFAIALTTLVIFSVAASYHRFLYSYDYLASYEGPCDPYTEECFVYCEDEACTEPFYYSTIERSARVIRQFCGDSVLDCAAAEACTDTEEDCVIYYCPHATYGDECETLTEHDRPPETTEETFF